MTCRLWITGLGLVTPLGDSVEATWGRLVRGDRAIRPITLFDGAGQRVALAAEVSGVTLPCGAEEDTASWSRTSAMALSAASEAMQSARLDASERRVGLVVGGTTGGMFETEQLLARLHAEPSSREFLRGMLSHPLTATGDRLNEKLGPFTRVRALSSACSSGSNALVVAAAWLLSGEVDAVVAGGSDALCRLTLSGFNALCAIDPEPCRPFHRLRRGTSLGEGAGFVVLERADDARARGAEPHAELAGWAVGAEAHHITNPAPDGVVVAGLLRKALARARLVPGEVDYVNAHGTGTTVNEAMEAAALARAFGDGVRRIPVSSSKGQIGHTLGAAGAIEAVITALVVARSTVVPTAGLDDPDPALNLLHVPHVGERVARVRAAVSNAFGFGGMDTVLVLAAPDRRAGPAVSVPAVSGISTSLTASDASAPELLALVVTGVSVFGALGSLGVAECAELPTHHRPARARCDPDAYLDVGRARRIDRAGRLGAVAVEGALASAHLDGERACDAGLVLGGAFGNVDASAAFMHRIFEKGPRSASPAEFPNLVPSSPVGHISIYAQMHGPAFATADLGTSGESAFVQACELVRAGEARVVVAGGLEPASPIVDRVLSSLFSRRPSQTDAPRADLAAALVLESGESARQRGAPKLARVVQILQWRGDGRTALRALGDPGSGAAEVIVPRARDGADALLECSSWRAVPIRPCAPGLGESDALGAVALAVAAARIAHGLAERALVVGLAQGRGYAIVLAKT